MAASPSSPSPASLATINPSTSRPAALPLPSLPLELVHLILDFAVPPAGYGEWPARKSVLCALSLVCRNWRETYQAQLFGDVVLRSVDSALQFREAVGDTVLAASVKTIRVGSQWEGRLQGLDGDASLYGLGESFRRCTNLKTVQIGRMDWMYEEDLAAATKLESLAIWDSHVVSLDVRLKTPIQHLFLDGNDYIDTDEMGLAYRLSTLSALAVPLHPPNMPNPDLWGLPPLKAFSLRGNRPVFYLGAMQGILLFHCDVEYLRHSSSFDILPSSLRYLRVTAGHFFGSDVLTPGLRSHEARLTNLEELILPLRLSTAAAFEELRSWAKEKGLRIRWERDEEGQGTLWDEGFWECVRRMETTLTEESKKAELEGRRREEEVNGG